VSRESLAASVDYSQQNQKNQTKPIPYSDTLPFKQNPAAARLDHNEGMPEGLFKGIVSAAVIETLIASGRRRPALPRRPGRMTINAKWTARAVLDPAPKGCMIEQSEWKPGSAPPRALLTTANASAAPGKPRVDERRA
jgi:hypothetical protein